MGIQFGDVVFYRRVDKGIRDQFMRSAVRAAQERMRTSRLRAAEELGDWEEWRRLGEEIRRHTLEHLDYYLEQLSDRVHALGGHVFFAQTAEEATSYIRDVVQKRDARRIVKSKSMVTEEISLNDVLEAIGCRVVETDLGEYILQVDDHDPPSHIVGPSVHKDRERIRRVFAEKLGYTGSAEPEEMTAFVRQQLRPDFLTAEVGITGCNFAVAESGTVCLVTNEGNGRLVTSLPPVHIAVMGMERIVPTWEELEVMVGLLCRSAVGQKLTSYINCLTGPKAAGDVDGPEEFHLVIIDNGRSDILGTEFQSVLQCIRCGACLNVCPVYRHIGGQAYGSIYSGPIGAVLSPLLGGEDLYRELPYASSLCAACTEACPVNIPLHELLIRHRQKTAEKKRQSPLGERLAMKAFGMVAESPRLYRWGTKLARTALRPWEKDGAIRQGPGPLQPWTSIRDLPSPKRETFREWLENRRKRGERP